MSKTDSAESRLQELRAKLTTLDQADRERRARVTSLTSKIEAAAEAAALTGAPTDVTKKLREQQAEVQAELAAAADIRAALLRLLAVAEKDRADELEAAQAEQLEQTKAELAGEVIAVHAAIGALLESCRSYLAAADAYSAAARDTDRDSRGHPARVRESLRGVLTIELREFAASQGAIPSGGRRPELYGSAFNTRDWLAA